MVENDRRLGLRTTAELECPRLPASLVALLRTVLDRPGEWMATPNRQLGGRKPVELVGTIEEVKIYDLLHAADQGLF